MSINRLARRIVQWPVCYVGLLLHGVSFLLLLLGTVRDPEERPWLRNNAGLDLHDHDGLPSTGTKDGWVRLWRDWKRILHELKNLPFELYKARPTKFSARISGFLLLVTNVAWGALWWWLG